MGNSLDVIVVILIVAWVVGFFAMSIGSTIHVLLVFVAIAVIIRVIQKRKNPLRSSLKKSSLKNKI